MIRVMPRYQRRYRRVQGGGQFVSTIGADTYCPSPIQCLLLDLDLTRCSVTDAVLSDLMRVRMDSADLCRSAQGQAPPQAPLRTSRLPEGYQVTSAGLRKMTSQTYLILIRDGSLALAVGAALEDRLVRDGHDALALVPAVRGLEFAEAGYHRHLGMWQADAGHPSRAPHVVALYEDGLLKRLEGLGLGAYIGVPHEEEWRIVHWDNDAGAILLPVATARDLVEAVADHTPWSRYAVEVPKTASPRRDGRRAVSGGPPALSRKLAVASAASVAGSLLLVVPASPVAASSSAPQVLARPGAASSGTVAAVETAVETSQLPADGFGPGPASNGSAGKGAPTSGSSLLGQAATGVQNFFNQVGAAVQRSLELQGQMEMTNAQANLAFGNAVIAAAPYAHAGFMSGAETGLLYGTGAGATIGTIGGAIVGGPPGALAGFKGGTELGLGAGVSLRGIIGAVNGFINAPVWYMPSPGTVTLPQGLGTVPQGPGTVPQGIRDQFGLGPNGSPLGSTTAPPQGTVPPGTLERFGLGPNGSPLGSTTAPPQGTTGRGTTGQFPPPGGTPPAQDTTGQGAPGQGTTPGGTPPAQDTTGQ